MANLASITRHSNRGTSVIVGEESDVYIYEAGGASVSGGVIYEPITTNEKGEMNLAKIEAKLNLDFSDPQYAKPTLICVETPHNRMGGDRKSTRLNSSHVAISYAVFCLKKKIKT